MTFALAFTALFIEAVAGYPDRLWQLIGHPVTWVGRLASRAEAVWNEPHLTFPRARLRGILALATLALVTVSTVLLVDRALDLLLPVLVALFVKALLASTLLAGRSLDEHVSAVAEALDAKSLAAGRTAVAQLVRRDVTRLDEAGVARTAIEGLAGNFAEDMVGPLLWLTIGGLPACALAKAVDAADDTLGHTSNRYLAFGWAAGKLNDLVNLPASRLSVLWIAAAARIMPGADWREALLTAVRDGPRHRSPNLGWPRAAMAGALGLSLGGPMMYAGKPVDGAWMGAGRRDVTGADIHRALRLFRIAYVLHAAALGVLAAIALLLF